MAVGAHTSKVAENPETRHSSVGTTFPRFLGLLAMIETSIYRLRCESRDQDTG